LIWCSAADDSQSDEEQTSANGSHGPIVGVEAVIPNDSCNKPGHGQYDSYHKFWLHALTLPGRLGVGVLRRATGPVSRNREAVSMRPAGGKATCTPHDRAFAPETGWRPGCCVASFPRAGPITWSSGPLAPSSLCWADRCHLPGDDCLLRSSGNEPERGPMAALKT